MVQVTVTLGGTGQSSAVVVCMPCCMSGGIRLVVLVTFTTTATVWCLGLMLLLCV